VEEAIKKFILRTLPPVPSQGKWTKSGPCLDMLLAGLWTHRVLVLLMDMAFKKMNKGMAFRVGENDDQLFVEEMAWQQVAGGRLNRSLAFLSAAETPVILTILAICKEVTRWWTAGFLRCAKGLRDPQRFPRLCDYVTDETSRVTWGLQYCACLLSGKGRRLLLLVATADKPSLQDWLQDCYEHARLLERTLLAMSCWAYRRHAVVFKS
jgi:hypothetical protein